MSVLSSSRGRWTLACGLFSAWLLLLFLGVALFGAVHLLVVAAVVIAPWREALRRDS